MNDQKRRLPRDLKKETNDIKTIAQQQSIGQTSTTSSNGQRYIAQQQVVFTGQFEASPLAYLRVIDNKPTNVIHIAHHHQTHQHQVPPHHQLQLQHGVHQPEKHYINNGQQQHQQQFVFAASSLQDGEASPYFSDSTLSNCDRDPDASDAVGGSSKPTGSDSQAQIQHSSIKHVHQVHQTSTNQPSRCNSATSSSGPATCLSHRLGGTRKRVMANERERERTKSLNEALEILRNRLPVSEAEKRSKIQTLRIAKQYIEFLTKVKYISSQDQQQNHQISSSTACNEPRQYDNSNHNHHNNKSRSFDKCNFQQQVSNSSQGGHNQPDSPLTYKFYKFRLKSHSRVD